MPARLSPFDWLDTRGLVCSALNLTGALATWERLVIGDEPLIVYYHNVHGPGKDFPWCQERSLTLSLELFEQQIEYLSRRYRIVSLEEAVAVRHRRAVALTFDDGYAGVYRWAFPVLRARQLPATVFLVTDFIGSSQPLWWDRLLFQVRRFRELPTEEQRDHVRSEDRLSTALIRPLVDVYAFLAAYKTSPPAARQAVDQLLSEAVGVPESNAEPIFLSHSEVMEMQRAGITFGAHTRTHPLLTWLDDAALLTELSGCREDVEKLTGGSSCWFAYPDGVFTAREAVAVRDSGFIGAVQTFRYPERTGRFAVGRVPVNLRSSASKAEVFSPSRFRFALSRLTRHRIHGLLHQRGSSGHQSELGIA